MASRGYQDLNMRVAGNSPYAWGGSNYTLIMFGAGDSYPSAVVTAAFTSFQTPDTPAGTNDIEHVHDFDVIVPDIYDAMSIIEGTVKGNIRFGVSHFGVGGEYTRITNINLILNAVDTNGSVRELSSNSVWSGTLQATTTTEVILQTRYWIDVEKIILDSSERLVCQFEFTATVHSIQAGDHGTLFLHCTNETEETAVSLPFVMS